MRDVVESFLGLSAAAKDSCAESARFVSSMVAAGDVCLRTVAAGGTLVVAGCGKSKRKAAHLYEELLARFRTDRDPVRTFLVDPDVYSGALVPAYCGPAATLVLLDDGTDPVAASRAVRLAAASGAASVVLGSEVAGASAAVAPPESRRPDAGPSPLPRHFLGLLLHLLCERFEPDDGLDPATVAVGAVRASAKTDRDAASDPAFLASVDALGALAAGSRGAATFLAGNGGSACDALDLADDLAGELALGRGHGLVPVPLLDPGYLTCVGNDWDFSASFSRGVGAARPGDILFAYSTSGRSPNIVAAAAEARARGVRTVGFTKGDGADLAPLCDVVLGVPAEATERVQEVHALVGAALCAHGWAA